jgi:hypothetical protein
MDAAQAYAADCARDLSAHAGRRLWFISSPWTPEASLIVAAAFDSRLRRVESISVEGGSGYDKRSVIARIIQRDNRSRRFPTNVRACRLVIALTTIERASFA